MNENLGPYPINSIVCDDCLNVLFQLPDECIDLIYIDPPFFSQANYKTKDGHDGFVDKWVSLDGYLDWLMDRISAMRRILKETGSIFVHCDWHASHYIKVKMDKIFGYDFFQNEVIWRYRRWTNAARSYQRMHDALLWYTKSLRYKFINQYQPFSEKTVIALYKRKVENGRAVRDKTCLMDRDPKQGIAMHDVWDISFINPVAKERTGYPTQKPEALLERIIVGHTDEDDTVADFFCGSGTTLVVAERLNRNWLGCDINPEAVRISQERIEKERMSHPLL